MRIISLFLMVLLNALSAFGQPKANYNKTQHNFGKVANLNYPPANFSITNTGDEPLAILMVHKSPSVKVSYTKGFISPAESGKILILPNLNKTGTFRETISVITNASEKPYELLITGEVVSIQACFPNPDNWNIRKVVAIDSDTKAPIPNVKIDFTHNMSKQFNGETGKKGEWIGEMPIGQYSFSLQTDRYYPLKEEKYVPRSLPVLFFEMKMIPPQIPEQEIVINEPDIIIPDAQIKQEENTNLLPTNLYAANNIVLLLDVSYSMRSNQKLELLKHSANNLTDVLRNIDNVSLITYSGSPTIVIKSIPGNYKTAIKTKVSALKASGITNGVKGLESAYALAYSSFIPGGNNQIILATDGQFTGGTQQPEAFKNMISDYAAQGIILSIIGFGVDNEAKSFMSEMSVLGKGNYIHVSSKEDISETLINEIKENSSLKH